MDITAEMMQKFFFKDFQLDVFPNVYMPREDSILLANNIEAKPNLSVLDLGCGCGIQGINAAIKGAAKVLCTDISKEALKCALHNAGMLGLRDKIEARESNLFEEVPEKFDCIIFNPPYLPSGKIKDSAVDGGTRGRKILDKFLQSFQEHLNQNGGCFFLQSSQNGEKETANVLGRRGIQFEIVARQGLFFEEIMVFRAAAKQ